MNHLVKNTALAFALFLGANCAFAQETWSLERCIKYAQENNFSIQQAEANVKLSLLSERQAKASRLPNLSASLSGGEQFGRTVDPTTNQFSTQATGYNSLGVDAGVTIFNGGLINHSIKQAGWDIKASVADAKQTSNDLALQVAAAYLNILLSEEQVQNAGNRVLQSQQQLANTLKLIDAGSLPAADRYTIDAQIAREQQSAVVSQNNVDLAYLSLKQLMQLEPDFDLKIEHPAIVIPGDANPDGLTLPPVYSTALGTQPSIQSAEFGIKSAEEGVNIARAAYLPTLSVYANLSSNYSTQYQDVIYTGNMIPGAPTVVNVNGTDVNVFFYDREYNTKRVPYFDQIDRNFGQGFGFNLRIPIYQNGRTQLSVERAKLGVLNAQLQDNQTRQTLKNDIQTAIANARSARKQLDAAQITVDATRIAYTNMEKRHTLGAVNTLDLTTSKNNLDIAEKDLIVAKYDYLFKLKILDFYQGKPLSVNGN